MSRYVHVAACELQIGDLVKGRGRLARDIMDHETREGIVVAVFERDIEKLVLFEADQELQVKVDADENY